MNREYLETLYSKMGFSSLVDKERVINNALGRLKEFSGSIPRAMHDVSIDIRSLGHYRSRDLNAESRLFSALWADTMGDS